MNRIQKFTLQLLALVSPALAVEDPDLLDLSLEELQNIEVTSSTLMAKKSSDVHANLSVVTREMILKRGYRNLVQVLEDIPGFDFATGEDGGGEYTTHSFHRGIGGDNGNSKILIMVNGVIQNFINNNWSTLWTDEMMLFSVKRIEIIQGPGSVIYGSNAVSGIIHFIMDDGLSGSDGLVGYGEGNSRRLDLRTGRAWENASLNLALHYFESDGDEGDRHDPGGYFHGNRVPNLLTQNIDKNGTYTGLDGTGNATVAHPEAGRRLKDGFDTSKKDWSGRFNIGLGPNLDIEGFYWEKQDGLGSYVPGYEYYTNTDNRLYRVHMKGYHLALKGDHQLTESLDLSSNFVHRVTEQSPDTGFHYTYRFHNLAKTYHSFSSQTYLEEIFRKRFDESSTLAVGLKFSVNRKMPQIVSLGSIQDAQFNGTTSSWEDAEAGNGLDIDKNRPVFHSQEFAAYTVYDKMISSRLGLSLGLRFDSNNEEFGEVLSPRVGLNMNWNRHWTTKFMVGEAFRQPSNFEYYDEFRGNPDLDPETVQTLEVQQSYYDTDELLVKLSLFVSRLKDEIQVVNNLYQNTDKGYVRGLVLASDFQASPDLKFFANGIFTEGRDSGESWSEIEHVAEWKGTIGMNSSLFNDALNLNLRGNYVGKTLAPTSNTWMWRHHNGYAPASFRVNATLTFRHLWHNRIQPQLVIRNLFDDDSFRLGRQGGNSDVADHDPTSTMGTDINPDGFIPAYHPQARRCVHLNFKVRF